MAADASSPLLRELKCAVRKGLGVAGEYRHIHRIGPTISLVVEYIAIALRSDISPAGTLEDSSLTERRSVACGLLHSQAFSLHRHNRPLFKCIVGGLNEIGLSWCTDVGTEMDEGKRALRLLATKDIRWWAVFKSRLLAASRVRNDRLGSEFPLPGGGRECPVFPAADIHCAARI